MPSRARWIVLSLALVAASAFALAMQSPWWTAGEASIGPFGSRHCFSGQCRETGLSWLGGGELWLRSAVGTRAAGYISMFVLIIVAARAAAKRRPDLAARAALVSILTAIAAGGYFFVSLPTAVVGREASLAYGPLLFLVAIVAGIAASITVLRSPTPT